MIQMHFSLFSVQQSPDYMIKTNLETLKLYNNYTQKEEKDILLDLDEKIGCCPQAR